MVLVKRHKIGDGLWRDSSGSIHSYAIPPAQFFKEEQEFGERESSKDKYKKIYKTRKVSIALVRKMFNKKGYEIGRDARLLFAEFMEILMKRLIELSCYKAGYVGRKRVLRRDIEQVIKEHEKI